LEALKTNGIRKFISQENRRKENNWKTEEALAPAVVSLETERIKESNP